MKKIVLITALWRRHELTRVFWKWFGHLREWWSDLAELEAVVALSDDATHAAMAEAAGAEWVDVPNDPLSRKFNATLKLARRRGADAVLVMGSDDVFCETIARAYRRPIRYAIHAGLRDLYFYDVRDGRLGYFPGYIRPPRIGEPAGCGRLIPAAILDSLGWSLWSERPAFSRQERRAAAALHGKSSADFRNHGLDHSSFRRIATVARDCHLIDMAGLGGTALDLKGCGNLWAWEQTNTRPLPPREAAGSILGRLPADVREMILAFRDVQSEAA